MVSEPKEKTNFRFSRVLNSANPLFPEPPRTTSSRRISTTPATLSGEFFRRPQPFPANFSGDLFSGEPTTYSEPPEADLHASGNPPATGVSRAPRADLPCRTVTHAPARDGAWLTFRPRRHISRLVRRRLGLLASGSPPSPASPPFVLFWLLPFRPHLTGLPLHLRGLVLLLFLSGTSRPFSPLIAPLTAVVSLENYLSWSASVELWFMGQGYEDHLVTQEADIPEAKGLYTNDIQRSIRWLLLLSISANRTWIYLLILLDKFFMVLTLIGLRPDLEPIRDQILGSSSVPSLDDVFARLLRLSSTQTLPSASASDSSVLVSHTTSRGGRSGTRGRGQRPHCTYCNKLGNSDRCYQLHGRPPRTAHMAQSSDSPLPQPPSSSASQTSQASIASVAQLGNASACLTHTSSLGPWILDSGASDHLSGIGLALPLLSTLTSVLYTPECPFNLISISKITRTLNCSITFSDKFVTLQDRSTGKTIGIGRESQGLYHLTSDSSPAVCISTDAPLLIHNVWATLVSPVSRRWFLVFPLCRRFRLNARIDILLRQLVLSSSIVTFLFVFGGRYSYACYLINRMPSSVLHDQIPHSLLFPDQPLYFLPPRVFGYFRRVIVVIPLRLIGTLSPLMSPSLRLTILFTTSESLPVSEVLPIPIVSPPEAMPPRPLQVYHRRPRVVAPLPFPEAPADSLPILRLHLPRLCLLLMTYPLLFGKSTHEALSHPGWRQAMVDEMAALHSNGTWDLVVLPPGKSTVGCRWVYAVKVGPDDCFCRLLLSMAAMCSWPLYQLDIKNAFLHGDLVEEVYMEQPPGFVAQGESGLVCRLRRSLYGLKQSPRAWFSRFSSVVQEFGMLRSSDQDGIQKLKQHLFTHFQTKDLGKLKYFLGIEIAQSSSGVVLSQRKTGGAFRRPGRYRRLVGKLNYLTITRPDISFPVSVVSQFLQSPCDSHWDAVIRILRYIKSTPGQGVLYENKGHTQVVGYTDADWAGSPTDRRSTSGYCVFIGGNLISWKSKKQDVVARSSAEAEYRAMALATCELIWLRHLLQELRFGKDEQMKLICDNQAALHIASNPVFHERTKHIEVDCHFIREKIASGCVATSFVNSNDQLADIFTKSLRGLGLNIFVTSLVHMTYMLQLEGEC
ncbi:Retrovirus-related Pol polyprotein from transposon RE2 [Vitis vinifera]|uniref:Retrovirus-related Pol polyprotein from transposon RE2 n=1 Tax=Vitis vinifera TaxID=29760 RepID=A0A438IND7_VITVI|nr:Retrovirus-related Pol polyprotein from transposon RE2 [Vitis vinifera]